MLDKKTIAVYDALVDDYAKMINQLPSDSILLGFIARFEKNDLVLDLGCGPAASSATMRDQGLRVDAIDASVEMVKLANQVFDIDARVSTFDNVIKENKENIYQGIWANFSLLHATRVEFPVILNALYRALKPNGFLHLGMKLGQGSKRDKIDRFYSYYSQNELQSYLNQAGFSIEKVELGEDSGLAGEIEPWLAITSISTK